MAQHIPIENYKEESWFTDVFGEITKALDNAIGKKGKYYSIHDQQTGDIMHTGRNSKTKIECATDSMSFFDDNFICGCGIEGWSYEDDRCKNCEEKCSEYMDKQLEFAKNDPDGYVKSNEAEIFEHEYPIPEDNELEDKKIPFHNGLKAQRGLTIMGDDRGEGVKAFGYSSENESLLTSDDFLKISDVGFEIHVGKKQAIYLVA